MNFLILHDGLWWRPDCHGYTHQLLEAGVFGLEQARTIERLRPGQDVAVPLADELARLQVNPAVLAALLRDGPIG